MPKRRRQPQVKPVKRYRAPKYPSHQDPDPTQHPYPVPYPFAPRLAATVAGLGILVGCEGQGDPAARAGGAAPQVAAAARALPVIPREAGSPVADVAPEVPGQPHVVEIDGDDTPAPETNPLALEESGLPHRTSMFGTGAPSYLDEDLARAVIERAFAAAGYDLDRDVQLEQQDLAFVADGYDAEQKVGYVWADYGSLDEDGVVSWQRDETPPTLSQRVEWLGWQVKRNPGLADLGKELKAAQGIADPARQAAALEALVEQAHQRLLSMAEARLLEARASREGFVAVISQFDQRFTYQGWEISDELRQELHEAEQLPDPAKKALAVRAVREKILREPLEQLERAVREYIAWARTQGG